MTSLPWLVIPGFLVPILLFTHVVIFTQLLAKTQTSDFATVWRRAGGQARSA